MTSACRGNNLRHDTHVTPIMMVGGKITNNHGRNAKNHRTLARDEEPCWHAVILVSSHEFPKTILFMARHDADATDAHDKGCHEYKHQCGVPKPYIFYVFPKSSGLRSDRPEVFGSQLPCFQEAIFDREEQ